MASLLSKETPKALYEKGYLSFSLGKNPENTDLFKTQQIPMAKILASPNAEKIIQKMPPQTLYMTFAQLDQEQTIEVLTRLSTDQWTRLVDYDTWHGGELIPSRFFKWLGLYGQSGPEQMARRFKSLEEEYQLALLGPHVAIFDKEQYEKMPPHQQDQLGRLAGEELFYAIKSEDPEVAKGIQQLVDSLMGEDMNYLLSLLAHSSYAVPHEAELLMGQFRQARLEEDGFVSYEESLQCFQKIDYKRQRQEWVTTEVNASENPLTVKLQQDATNLFDRTLANLLKSNTSHHNLYQQLISLSNSLCSACDVETYDLHALKRILTYTKGLVNLGLQYLSNGDEQLALQILVGEKPKTLFRVGLHLVRSLQEEGLKVLGSYGLFDEKTLKRLNQQQKNGQLLDLLDKKLLPALGLQYTEILKGFYNRFPLLVQKERGDSIPQKHLFFTPVSCLSQLEDMLGILRAVASICEFHALKKEDRKDTSLKEILKSLKDRPSQKILIQWALTHELWGQGEASYKLWLEQEIESLPQEGRL